MANEEFTGTEQLPDEEVSMMTVDGLLDNKLKTCAHTKQHNTQQEALGCAAIRVMLDVQGAFQRRFVALGGNTSEDMDKNLTPEEGDKSLMAVSAIMAQAFEAFLRNVYRIDESKNVIERVGKSQNAAMDLIRHGEFSAYLGTRMAVGR